MTTTEVSRPQVVSHTHVATQREDLIGVLFGLALVGGVLSDAWAHVNVLSTLESFFTPWHALLYTGFAGTAAWTWWLAFRHRCRRRAMVGQRLAGRLPDRRHRLAHLLGWRRRGHVVAPDLRHRDQPQGRDEPQPHDARRGRALLLTSQLRSWWASGEGGLRAATGVLSAALGTMMGTILIIGMTGANTIAPTREYTTVVGAASTSTGAAQGIQAYLLGTVVVLVPVMLILRRRATPVVATGVAGVIGVFLMVEREFPMPLTAALIGMIAGAAIADAVVYRLDMQRGLDAPMRLPIAGAIIAASLWAGHLIGLQLAAGIRWPVELWAGVVVLTAVLGALLGTLSRSPTRL